MSDQEGIVEVGSPEMIFSGGHTLVPDSLDRLLSEISVVATRDRFEVAARDEGSTDELYRIRAVLDGLSAEAVARRHAEGQVDPGAVQRLWDLAQQADQATRAGNVQQGALHNRTFHQAIASLSANGLVVALLERVWDQIQVSTESSLEEADRVAAMNDEHLVVLTRIAAEDTGGAFVSAREHALATSGARCRRGDGAI